MRTAHLLDGVTVPLVTAFDDTGRPSADAARPLVEAMARSGVDSLMLLGSNGEGALLPPSWTPEYVAGVSDLWRELRPGGRVVVNVSAPGTAELLQRAELVLGSGPDALVVSPPRYFGYRPEENIAHIRALDRLEYAYVVYNIPAYAAPLDAVMFAELLESPWVVGMKDSSGDRDLFAAFLRLSAGREDVGLAQGDERGLLAALAAGATGIVPGIANIAPVPAVRLVELQRTDRAAATRAQEVLGQLLGIHAIRPGVPSIKGILHDRGLIATPTPAAPLGPLRQHELEALRSLLAPHEADLIGRRRG